VKPAEILAAFGAVVQVFFDTEIALALFGDLVV